MTRHLPSADAVPVDTLRLDDFETGLLAVLRHVLTAYAHPDSQSWQAAFSREIDTLMRQTRDAAERS